MFIDNVWDNVNAIYDTSDSNIGIWRNKGKNYVLNLTTFEYHEASKRRSIKDGYDIKKFQRLESQLRLFSFFAKFTSPFMKQRTKNLCLI